MSCNVQFGDPAEQDLVRIADYVSDHDSVQRATHIVTELQEAIATLYTFPNRGTLLLEGIPNRRSIVRQLLCGVYSIVYENDEHDVRILAVADCRRNLQRLLQERVPLGLSDVDVTPN
jgi:plasmid stabilization system protein ParE